MSALSRRRWDYDLLRVASMVGVVYLHTAAGALRQLGTPLWHFSNLLSSLATAAVPLFFMLSGALLLSHPRTAELGTLFRRRLPKVLILCWPGRASSSPWPACSPAPRPPWISSFPCSTRR